MKKQGRESKNTIRRVDRVDLVREGNDDVMYRVDIILKGALYKMVRNMVGTALDVAKGNLDEEVFLQLLHQRDDALLVRDDNPCEPAPPQGLTLEHVYFDDEF
eukprot:CAMPEP_0118721994 /NCGR_PEP_ID=MMETSP0800-20121206/31094_1 /TAXON_ID=210618 ORGANISM="Striatella unipunctata, Strain CCMP2910" /NCGR_SAMPLE_ID=MMETSP0800 /ASSEMBLY_ACC=CAM_ASM_000638 /LENGTH=102 /DNA_ID=CAMNT_0006630045 /DNA_START=368 /DNA_END=676 /DNA_ORIENTATION=-